MLWTEPVCDNWNLITDHHRGLTTRMHSRRVALCQLRAVAEFDLRSPLGGRSGAGDSLQHCKMNAEAVFMP